MADAKSSMERIKSRVLERIAAAEPSERTRFTRVISSTLRMAFMVGEGFIENLVKLQAMALVFKTLVSLAPLLAVVFSVLKAFGVHNRMEPALLEALAPLGEKGEEITARLIGFVDNISAGALGSIGLATLFITVLSLMGTIEQAFNTIWHVKAPRRFARRFSDYLSVLLVGPVLLFSALTVTATLQSNTVVQTLISIEPFGTVWLVLLRFVPYLTIWGALSFLYVFIPNTRVKISSAVLGGMVAAILWETVGWGFAVFVASSTRYYAVYSGFAILLLFLLWLYIGWVIVLLGAQVAYAHQHLHFYEGENEAWASSAAGRERLVLQMMFLMGRSFHHGLPPLSIADFAARLRLPTEVVKEFTELLQERRLAVPLADEQTFVPARELDQISLKEILDCARSDGGRGEKPGDRLMMEDRAVEGVLEEVERSVKTALEGKTLKTLVLAAAPPPAQ